MAGLVALTNRARCLECDWTATGPAAYAGADKHTKATRHSTVAWAVPADQGAQAFDGASWPWLTLECKAPADALCHADWDCECEAFWAPRVVDGVPQHETRDDAGEALGVHTGRFVAECSFRDWLDNDAERLSGKVRVAVEPVWDDDEYTFVLSAAEVSR